MKSNVMGLTVLASLLLVGSASAESTALDTSDNVAISFWIATAMMLASTIFFLVERSNVAPKWRTSVTVAALVTGVAWYHYTYMRDHWVMTGESPLVLRYIDWLITVPLQVVEFYLILAAIGVASAMLFWRLLGASIVMLAFGFFGESGAMDQWLAWIIGMAAWLYIIYEIWAGDAKKAAEEATEGVQFAFKWMTYILTFGWAIYPVGYVIGMDADADGQNMLNIVYNIADVVNKTAFGLMVWYAATIDTAASESAKD
ncbi:MAG: Green-light absorbing proteorhodopsin [Chloroflexota bacterium]|nr:MAG: Green-light absorbing proteorhodopsin [Chloroflexota bacterium]